MAENVPQNAEEEWQLSGLKRGGVLLPSPGQSASQSTEIWLFLSLNSREGPSY